MPYEWVRPLAKAPESSGAFCHADGDAPAAVLHLWPHRSLPRRGFVLFIGLTCGLIAIPLLALLGSPVLWGIAAVLRAGRGRGLDRTATQLSRRAGAGGTQPLVRSHGAGAAQPARPAPDWEANPYWVKLPARNRRPGGELPHPEGRRARGRTRGLSQPRGTQKPVRQPADGAGASALTASWPDCARAPDQMRAAFSRSRRRRPPRRTLQDAWPGRHATGATRTRPIPGSVAVHPVRKPVQRRRSEILQLAFAHRIVHLPRRALERIGRSLAPPGSQCGPRRTLLGLRSCRHCRFVPTGWRPPSRPVAA
jgi:hypothetical protein